MVPKKIILSGSWLVKEGHFLERVVALQGTGDDLADWIPQNNLGAIYKKRRERGFFARTPPNDTWFSLNSMLFGASKEVPIKVVPKNETVLPDAGDPARLVILITPEPDPEAEETDIEWLEYIVQLTERDKRKVWSDIVVVMVDALSVMEVPPPPIDAVDNWENRVRPGLPIGGPPMEYASDVENWRALFADLDIEWGRRLSSLNSVAQKLNIDICTIPMSISGFVAKTGVIQRPPYDAMDSVPFNVKIFVQALAQPSLKGFFNCFDPSPDF